LKTDTSGVDIRPAGCRAISNPGVAAYSFRFAPTGSPSSRPKPDRNRIAGEWMAPLAWRPNPCQLDSPSSGCPVRDVVGLAIETVLHEEATFDRVSPRRPHTDRRAGGDESLSHSVR
jgi:hypothetical protein